MRVDYRWSFRAIENNQQLTENQSGNLKKVCEKSVVEGRFYRIRTIYV